MIEAKGSRETAVSTTAGHERYVLKNVEQRSSPSDCIRGIPGRSDDLLEVRPFRSPRSEVSEDQSRQPLANEADIAAPADGSVQSPISTRRARPVILRSSIHPPSHSRTLTRHRHLYSRRADPQIPAASRERRCRRAVQQAQQRRGGGDTSVSHPQS